MRTLGTARDPGPSRYAAAAMHVLDGSPLHIDDVLRIARDREPVAVGDAARDRMRPAADLVAQLNAENAVAYGVTTGFGALADRAIAPADRATLQRRLILSHASGTGAALDAEVVRGMLLLRARTLCAGYSGVRPEVAEALVALLNSDVVPFVPRHGSLGASGDLAPLAHAASVLIGAGEATVAGVRMPGAVALAGAGLTAVEVGPKEGLALINGTDAMAATLALAVYDIADLLRLADCAAAMSIEALFGTVRVFDADVVALRPAAGQTLSAANLRALLEGSAIVAAHRDSKHAVQDAYSLRCAPQVHGAGRDVIEFCRATTDRELASVVDNPVVLSGRDAILSTGNFHGQALAYAADAAAMVCADVAAISERRVDRLLDPARSRGLPAFLVADPGLNSGFMIAQYTAAGLVSALRHAATPFSVQSMSTSAGQEDHVSMGFEAALRTRESVVRLRSVLAVEILCAAQALELRAPLRAAPATAAIVTSLRGSVDHLDSDRPLAADMAAAEAWIEDGVWIEAVRGTAGRLQ